MPSSPKRHRIPPIPQFTVFEDRDDGTLWVLSFTVDDDDTLRITLDDEGLERTAPLPPRRDYVLYPAEQGLDMGNGVRWFVRGGRIGYEMIDYRRTDKPPVARSGVEKETHLLIVPTTWQRFPDRLGWVEESPI